MTDTLLQPFVEFPFMRRALVATLALSLGCAPIGCVLVLRRMSLVGDAMAHAVLHDLEQVREHFEQVLLLARERVAWGPTADVLKAEHLFKARQMAEAWDEAALRCEVTG